MKNLRLGLLSIFLIFIGISNVYADRVCTYQNGTDYTVTCNVDGTKKTVSCDIIANANYKVKDLSNNVSYNDFSKECASSVKVMASVVNYKFEIEGIVSNTNSSVCGAGELHFCKEVAKTGEEEIGGSSGNAGEAGNTGFGGESGGNRGEGFTSSEYLKDPEYIAAYNDANKYCDSTDPIYNDSLKCEEARQKMEEIKNKYNAKDGESTSWTGESFCQRKEVKGAFRAIGWVFFIIKILVPIIIIIFGTIDFAKAVIASKDDEIKKSAVSLAKRAVIGILIFFIPTIIDFIVGLIGGNDVYDENSGSFGYCTHCMLKPTDDTCGNLRGN